jgi:hypothetical protein
MPKYEVPYYMAENYDVVSGRYTKQSRAKKLENLGRWLIDAAKYGNLRRATRLLKAGADVFIGDGMPLLNAQFYHSGSRIQKLLEGAAILKRPKSEWINDRQLFGLEFLECVES